MSTSASHARDTSDLTVSEAGRVRVGARYRYVGRNGGGVYYRVLGIARHGKVASRVVVYVGLDGRDLGQWWTATLAEFVGLFEPAPEAEAESASPSSPPAAAEVSPDPPGKPGRTLDLREKGPGW